MLAEKRAELKAELDAVDRALDVLRNAASGSASSRGGPRSGDSVSSLALDIVKGSDQEWSAAQIVTVLRQQGKALSVKDPMNSVRTALARSVRDGLIKRTGDGRYAAIGWMSDAERLKGPQLTPHDYSEEPF